MVIHSAKAAWLRSLAQPTRPHSKPGKAFQCTSMMTTRPCRSWKLCARSKLQASRLRWPNSTDLLTHDVVQLHGFAAHFRPLQLLLNQVSWPHAGAVLLSAAQTHSINGTQLTSLSSKSLMPHAYAELDLRLAADPAQCVWPSEGTEWEWPQRQPWSLLSWRLTLLHSCVPVSAVSRCSLMQCISLHLCSHSFKLWTQVGSCQKAAVSRCVTASSSWQATICCRLHSTERMCFCFHSSIATSTTARSPPCAFTWFLSQLCTLAKYTQHCHPAKPFNAADCWQHTLIACNSQRHAHQHRITLQAIPANRRVMP